MIIISSGTKKARTSAVSGFTLAEALVAVLLGSVMLLALYASFTCGYTTIRVTREDLRATEIMLTRLERVRLCTYSELSNAQTNPPTAVEYYDPTDQASGKGGVVYTVTYSVKAPTDPLPAAYKNNMWLVTVGVSWTNNSSATHSRSMQTYVATNGINGYVMSKRN
ncbi:MAG: hypothetical protein EPO07_11120 [Verrucomicrobia bacterium]|nr:MAG: hypothetical protein EPO07_11120 [Verrucomicrobiota bacterium]